jgi:hypothetical protein
MTSDERNSFLNRVIDVVEQQKASENFPYYSYFIAECEKFELTEADFNKQILLDATLAYKGPVEPTSGRHCILFGKKCYSLTQLGTQLFDHPAKSERYLTDAILFKEDVRKLEDSDLTMSIMDVFESETDVYRRYLKVMYHLNPRLPFRIDAKLSERLQSLLLKGFENYDFYTQVYKSFESGFLEIWLTAGDPQMAAKLPPGKTYLDFLTFLYAVDASYPFYLDRLLIQDPQDLIAHAQRDFKSWPTIEVYLNNGQLSTWFIGIGKAEWNKKIASLQLQVDNLPYYDTEEKKQAIVQMLMQVIDVDRPFPKLSADKQELKMEHMEASSTIQVPIVFNLENQAFLKAVVRLDEQVDGISISKTVLSLNSFENSDGEKLYVEIDAVRLVKGRIYKLNLIVNSTFETLTIPIILDVVFPMKTYLKYLAKYAFFGLLYFLVVRGVLMLVTEESSRYLSLHTSFNDIYYDLPVNYFLYTVLLVVSIVGLWQSYRWTRKYERL